MENAAADMIIAAVRTVRVPAMPGEYDIHFMVAAALSAAGLEHAHEYRLGPRCRLDFMCGGVAIEIKKGRPQPKLLAKQLARYMESPQVREMIVITQRRVPLPEYICGKPVHAVPLNTLWGVALP